MKNKFFFGLATLTMTFALLLSVAGREPQDIAATKRPTAVHKLTLPCKITNKDAGSRLDVTNITDKAWPVNRLIYYSTNQPDSGSFKTSSPVAAHAETSFYA